MKTAIVYHANCNDGLAAAMVATDELNKNNSIKDPIKIDYFEFNYNDCPISFINKAKEKEYDKIYILDFSFDVPDLKLICQCAKGDVVLIDHHEGAIDKLKQFLESNDRPSNLKDILNVEYSGAILTWMYFNQNWVYDNVPLFLKYINDRDLWQWKLPLSREFSAGINTLDRTITEWMEYYVLSVHSEHRDDAVNDPIKQIISFGTPLIKFQDNMIDYCIKNNTIETMLTVEDNGIVLMPTPRGCTPIKMVNAPKPIGSDVCSKLLKSGYKVAIYYEVSEKGVKVGVRSSKDSGFNCNTFCQYFNGGGHENSAGFRVQSVNELVMLIDGFVPN